MRKAISADGAQKPTKTSKVKALTKSLSQKFSFKAKKVTLKINEEQFSQFAIKYPCILFPAMCILDTLREQIGGTEFWEAITEARVGSGGMSEYLTFSVDLKRKTLKNGGLGDAFTAMKSSIVTNQDAASRKIVQQLKDNHNRSFGINSTNSSFRSISLLRQASSLIGNVGKRMSMRNLTSNNHPTTLNNKRSSSGNGTTGNKRNGKIRPY